MRRSEKIVKKLQQNFISVRHDSQRCASRNSETNIVRAGNESPRSSRRSVSLSRRHSGRTFVECNRLNPRHGVACALLTAVPEGLDRSDVCVPNRPQRTPRPPGSRAKTTGTETRRRKPSRHNKLCARDSPSNRRCLPFGPALKSLLLVLLVREQSTNRGSSVEHRTWIREKHGNTSTRSSCAEI